MEDKSNMPVTGTPAASIVDQYSVIKLRTTKGDSEYEFIMPAATPLGAAYDAGIDFLRQIVEFSRRSVESSERKPEDANNKK